jgi:hypothetical protein
MSAITAKNIRPVMAGVGYAKNMTPQAAEFAQIDQQLSAYGLDGSSSDVLAGRMSLAQDPQNLGTAPTLTTSGSIAVVVESGGVIGSVLGSGGRIALGAGDVPTYSPSRSRTVRMSMLEAARVDDASALVVDPTSGGVTAGSGAGALNQFRIPIAKPHDGATLSTVRVFFFLRSEPSALAVTMPFMRVYREDLSGNVVTFSAGDSYPTPASTELYYNNGQALTLTGTTYSNNVINVALYTYTIALVDDNGPVDSRPIYTAIELDYTAISDNRWTQ